MTDGTTVGRLAVPPWRRPLAGRLVLDRGDGVWTSLPVQVLLDRKDAALNVAIKAAFRAAQSIVRGVVRGRDPEFARGMFPPGEEE